MLTLRVQQCLINPKSNRGNMVEIFQSCGCAAFKRDFFFLRFIVNNNGL